MRFEITNDHHILTITADLETDAAQSGSTFATEQELREIAGGCPMKRLTAIWNHLPGIQTVEKFENRSIAIARIWRAIQPEAQQSDQTMRPSRTRRSSRTAFRERSKATEVCALLHRPEGATLDEIRTVTGWQAHTVRGFISRTLQKQGRQVRSSRKNGERVYHLRP